MNDKQLIEQLVASGFLTKDLGEKLLAEALLAKKRVEDFVYERNAVGELDVAAVKSKILGIPYKKISLDQLSGELMKLVPEETIINYKVIPLSRDQNMLVVGMLHPDDQKAQEALRFIAKQNKISLGVYLITPSDLEAVIRKYSPYTNQIENAVKSLNLKNVQSKMVKLEGEMANAEEAPIIKIVASFLKEAVNLGASDIHIEPQRTRLRVRFRVDGVLRDQSSLPVELQQPIISRVKVLSNLKIDENRVPQDGRFRTVIFNRDIDFRVSTFPTPAGEKAAIRVLDPNVGLKKLDELGLVGRNLETVKRAIAKPFGMVILSGPTGSGKTTTLYALMQLLNRDDVNIVSLEDPVEYTIDGVNQSQVRPEIGYDFASGLRQILRQDPDVIMVGEIRDKETAGLSVNAALTGHVVLSTLHTNNAISIIPRLIDLKVDSFLLPSSLNLMVAQRLISRLCDKCKKAEKPSADLLKIIKLNITSSQDVILIYRPVGCAACNNKGVLGRIAIFEIFEMTPQLTEIISGQINENKLLEEAKRQGMITMRQDGIAKALEGLVGIEEVLRETNEE